MIFVISGQYHHHIRTTQLVWKVKIEDIDATGDTYEKAAELHYVLFKVKHFMLRKPLPPY